MTRCAVCAEEVAPDAVRCPHCGERACRLARLRFEGDLLVVSPGEPPEGVCWRCGARAPTLERVVRFREHGAVLVPACAPCRQRGAPACAGLLVVQAVGVFLAGWLGTPLAPLGPLAAILAWLACTILLLVALRVMRRPQLRVAWARDGDLALVVPRPDRLRAALEEARQSS
jgi:hypothetical protein